jgi:hypothetical protein
LRIYKKRSIWRLRGDAETGVLEQTNSEIGLIGASAIASVGGIDYIQGQEGIYACDGDRVVKITGAVDPLFRDGVTFSIGAQPTTPLDGDETLRAKNCLAVKNGRLYFSYCAEAVGFPSNILVCDLETKSWHSEDNPVGSGLGYTALYYEGQYGELLGATSGVVYALEYRTTSESVDVRWTSAYRDQGRRDRQKMYADLEIEHSVKRSTSDQTLTVKAKIDNGNSGDVSVGVIPIATSAAGADRLISRFPIGSPTTRAKNLAVLVEGETTQEVVLYSTTVHYYMEPRDALTFDSGIIDLGDPNPKGIDIVWLDIEPTANVTYTLSSDLPGNAVASRQTSSTTITGTQRRTFAIEINNVDGRLVRLQLTSTGTFRLYTARLAYRRIGLYLDGTQGNTWSTTDRPFSIAA